MIRFIAYTNLSGIPLASWRAKSHQAIRFLLRIPTNTDAPAIPLMAPLSSGLDAAAFQQHYACALQSYKCGLQQIAFSLWYFYVAPILIGMIPGKLYADLLNPVTADDMAIWWIPTLLTQLVITPLLMRYRRKHKSHKRHQIYYTAALEACLNDDAARTTQEGSHVAH